GLEPPVIGSLLQTAVGGTLASYSRDDEREADRVGITYLARAGYDPSAQADFLDALARNARLDAEIAGTAYDPEATGFFATHPATAGRGREARAAAAAASAATGLVDGERGRDRHLAAIEGMAWGPSADQGFVADGSFVHPVLDFRFGVPRGWNVANRPDAVILGARDGARVIFDADRVSAGRGGADPADYITADWLPALRHAVRTGEISRLERTEIGGLPAARALLPIRVGNTTYAGLLVAISRGDRVFRFIGLVPGGRQGAGTVTAVTESFRGLTTEERRDARQRRIAVARVAPGETEAAVAARMAVVDAPLARFRVLNDREAGEPLQPGTPVKLIR
ncbi:MAG: M48 family metalloprotease, partial [Pseudomonadota bacterium]